MDFLKDITPREYQKKILETCKEKNCLVILPTGIGKTLIALMLTIERMQKFPSQKILFLAPTRPLVEQHLEYFKKHLTELFGEMTLFTGKIKANERKKLWQNSDIIFSTPQCIANDLKINLYNLKDVSLLIEDEAHRCLKKYDYTAVARAYKQQALNPLILGMTASPGSTKEKIQEICKNLSIEAVEIRTRDSEDVSEYLQELTFTTINLDFPPEFEEIRQLLKIIYNNQVEELKSRNLLHEFPTKTNLIKLQGQMIKSLNRGNNNFNLLRGLSICAIAIKLQHAMEMLETQTLQGFHDYLKDLFDQAAKSKSQGVKRLVTRPEFTLAYHKTMELMAKKIEHPKLAKLKEIIEAAYLENPKTKIIIFSQYRNTAALISKKLNEISKVKTKVFIGQTKKLGQGLTQKEQKQVLIDFASGEINAICATAIGEEGLDIPEVNKVIFYEPVPSEIRKIQRAGRTARLFPGELIILITKKTRDESFHWASKSKEKKMYRSIEDIKEQMNEKNEIKQKSLEEFK